MILKKIFLRVLMVLQISRTLIINQFLKFISNLYQTFFNVFLKSGLDNEIKTNRKNLTKIKNFVSIESYNNSPDLYGLPKSNFKFINSKQNNYPTYSDLLCYISKQFRSTEIKYIEIGVSVLKNFYQISSYLNKSKLYAFDINEINPEIEKLFLKVNNDKNVRQYEFKSNKIHYFQGSVFNKGDLNNFLSLTGRANIIFSDAHHSYEGLVSEYKYFIENALSEEFLIYYDDLSPNLLRAFKEISLKINKKHRNVCSATFLINGWLGNHEKMHKNGFITNINLEEAFKRDGVKLLNIKFLN